MTDVQAPACIFCGGKTVIGHSYAHEGKRHFAGCVVDGCLARGPERPTPTEAVAAFLKPVADARRPGPKGDSG